MLPKVSVEYIKEEAVLKMKRMNFWKLRAIGNEQRECILRVELDRICLEVRQAVAMPLRPRRVR